MEPTFPQAIDRSACSMPTATIDAATTTAPTASHCRFDALAVSCSR